MQRCGKPWRWFSRRADTLQLPEESMLFSARDEGSKWSDVPDLTPIVFVVDDDISMRESLEALIGVEGWQVECFATAQEFLSRPPVLIPSCLVLDVYLPGLNGLDLQRSIAGERAYMPIIFITGYGDVPT